MGTDQKFFIVLTTFPADGDAEQFASRLVEEKLAACVNILPVMKSVYAWKGALERSDERQLLIKTTDDRLGELEARLLALHPYEVPEFLLVPIAGGCPDYLSWVVENTRP